MTRTTYSTVVYMQGDEGWDAHAILDEYGPNALLEHLTQWDHGEDHDVRDTPPYPSNYRTFEWDMGDFTYVIAYHRALGDMSLNRVTTY